MEFDLFSSKLSDQWKIFVLFEIKIIPGSIGFKN